MAYRSLRDFIARLESTGRLNRVSAPVSPYLEMTEIQTRLIAEQGPAVLFENVVGDEGTRYDMPVLVNLFGTVERVAWGMDREPAGLRGVGETLAFLRQPEPPGGWRQALDMLPIGAHRVMAMKPKHGRQRTVPGDRADRRRYRSRSAADPDLLARRARAVHHLAADRDAGTRTPKATSQDSVQSRNLSHCR